MKRLLISLLAITAIAYTHRAHAGVVTIPYDTIGGWTVAAVPSAHKCMAQATYPIPGIGPVTMSFEMFINGNASLGIGSEAWMSRFKQGGKYWVGFSVDGKAPQRLLGNAFFPGMLAFDALTTDGIITFAQAATFSLTYGHNFLGTYNLPGSYEAVESTLTCSNKLRDVLAATTAPVQPVPAAPMAPAPVAPTIAPAPVAPAPAPAAPKHALQLDTTI